ncbi:hypothetical protein MLD38_010122 [Melastoma candidum]|uniref:Uncharacterized protein n=1 Tax=Melastoma candidum TaxID=119954 RepID=A0ACB9QYT8_9MYRT|nr:hypothetical protein MLD38_010122 [Melastoma candidum]
MEVDASAAGRDWLDLPREILTTILLKLDVVEILTSAQRVCNQWRSVCLDPSMWRRIDMWNSSNLWDVDYDQTRMCMHAIDRSLGCCEDIAVQFFGNDQLLLYIAGSCSKLRRLRLVSCGGVSDEGLCEAVGKLPLLEEIELYHCELSGKALETIGRSCPRLKSFKLNNIGARLPLLEYNDEALAIAKNMPGLRHLMLFGNRMSNVGLMAILDGCPHLESLDLRQCYRVDLKDDLARRCERIKNLNRPLDCTEDYEFQEALSDSEDCEDYPTGFSDIDYFSDDYGNYFEFSGESDYDLSYFYYD